MSELRTLRSFFDTLHERGDRPAVLALHKEDVESWSYDELVSHAQRLASGLIEAGVDEETTWHSSPATGSSGS